MYRPLREGWKVQSTLLSGYRGLNFLSLVVFSWVHVFGYKVSQPYSFGSILWTLGVLSCLWGHLHFFRGAKACYEEWVQEKLKSTFFSAFQHLAHFIWLACWADRRPNTNHLHSWAPNLLIGTGYKAGIMVAHHWIGGVSHLQSHPCSLAPAVGLRAHCFSQEQKWISTPAWHFLPENILRENLERWNLRRNLTFIFSPLDNIMELNFWVNALVLVLVLNYARIEMVTKV